MIDTSKFLPIQHCISIFILFFSGIVSGTTPIVYIELPENGAFVQSPVEIIFALDGMELAPAGTYEPDTGHHHLIIDTELPDFGMPIPSNKNHLHFGKAQDRVLIDLESGIHTLQLLLGDGSHIPHRPPLISEKIEITIVPQ